MMSSSTALSLALMLAGCPSAAAFVHSSACGPRTCTDLRAKHDDETSELGASRRDALQTLSLAFISAAAISSAPQSASAASDLFKPNPLTNPVLEQMRIWEQDEKDNIKYGGELESGTAKITGLEQYTGLLQPILTVEKDLATIDKLLTEGKPSTKEDYTAVFEKVDGILALSIFDKISFKKAFNAFADNIYYSDPDRANLYLGGGAIPKNSQSIAYLLRNDMLTNIEDMRPEVKYLMKELGKKGSGETVAVGEGGLELEEILGMSKTANEGMKKYLDLVPPKELDAARAKFAA
ncbi:hypothetical protein ACHAXT_009132 [Thalassiosira profunda]